MENNRKAIKPDSLFPLHSSLFIFHSPFSNPCLFIAYSAIAATMHPEAPATTESSRPYSGVIPEVSIARFAEVAPPPQDSDWSWVYLLLKDIPGAVRLEFDRYNVHITLLSDNDHELYNGARRCALLLSGHLQILISRVEDSLPLTIFSPPLILLQYTELGCVQLFIEGLSEERAYCLQRYRLGFFIDLRINARVVVPSPRIYNPQDNVLLASSPLLCKTSLKLSQGCHLKFISQHLLRSHSSDDRQFASLRKRVSQLANLRMFHEITREHLLYWLGLSILSVSLSANDKGLTTIFWAVTIYLVLTVVTFTADWALTKHYFKKAI